MRSNLYHRASIISAAIGLVVILAVYLAFCTVDLVFIKDDHEIYRMEKVHVYDDVTVDPAEVEGNLDLEYTYVNGEEVMDFENSTDFKIFLGKKALINLITFKWEPHHQEVILTAK